MTVSQPTYSDVWNTLVRAERRSGVLTAKLQKVQVYPFYRTRIYYTVLTSLGIFDDPHPTFASHSSDDDAPADRWDAVIDEIAQSQRARTVVVPWVRKVGSVDPYSEPVLSRLAASSVHAFRLDIADPEADIDDRAIKAWARTAVEPQVAEELRASPRDVARMTTAWQNFSDSVRDELPAADLGKFAEFPFYLARSAIAQTRAYSEVFRRWGTRQVFIVNAYSHPAIVAGAKAAGARVIELQHGFLSPYHPAYSFPHRVRVQSSPHRIITWGSFWREGMSLARGTDIRSGGATESFELARTNALADDERSNMLVVTSQGAVGEALFSSAVAFARAAPELDVVFRLHPNESLSAFEQLLGALREPPANLSLSHGDPPFMSLLSSARFVVGAFSTTLYEGLALGARVIALTLPGHENLERAVARGDMQLLPHDASPAQIRTALDESRAPSHGHHYYAPHDHWKRAIDA